jgi:hypothetical protein
MLLWLTVNPSFQPSCPNRLLSFPWTCQWMILPSPLGLGFGMKVVLTLPHWFWLMNKSPSVSVCLTWKKVRWLL